MYISIGHLIAIGFSLLAAGALITTRIEFVRNYNLWDWLRDKYLAFRGVLIHDAQVVIKLSSSEYHHLTSALDKIPQSIKWAIRRR